MNFQGFGGDYQSAGNVGGGFMSPGTGSPMGSQKKKYRSQTLLPVTAAIIEKAVYNVTEDIFSYEGTDIHQVTFVGIIREIQEAATNISYKIDDMTGSVISVKKWMDPDEVDNQKRSECREDTYVRVVGNVKAFNEGKIRSVMAFSVVPITEFDEITFHFLDVIYANLSLKKNSNNPGTVETPMKYGEQADTFGGGVNDAGLTGLNKVVFNYIASCSAEQGISTQELKQKNRNMNDQQLRNCLDWLSNEGHIYSTIDDDHYRSTSS